MPGMSAGVFNPAPGSSSSGTGGGGAANTMVPLVISSGTNYQPTSLGAQAVTDLRASKVQIVVD